MKKNTLIAGLLAATVILSGTATYAFGNNHGNGQGNGKHFSQHSKQGGWQKGGQRGGNRRGMPAYILEAADTDKDGKISQDEMKAYQEAEFKKYDADGNGTLSEDELTAMRDAHKAAMQAERFAKLDTNSDGQISPEELANAKNNGSNGRFGGHRGKR